jgi:hypothetical protein
MYFPVIESFLKYSFREKHRYQRLLARLAVAVCG